MIVQHNIQAMNANRILGMNNTKLAGTLEKLSSGYQVNRSADNAAGLAISEKMRTMIHGITQAEKNCHDAVSLVQTAEGALNEVHSMLQRMNELANQAANGSYSDGVDRASLQLEFTQIQEEIDHVAEHTDFNGMKLFDGTGGTYTLSSGNTATNYVKKEIPTLEELLSDKSGNLQNIIYTETVFDFETTQSGQSANNTSSWSQTYKDTANALQTSIVPQAVQAILNKYSAFNYLTGSSIGIGLELYSDSSTTLASVSVAPEAYQNTQTGEIYATGMTYKLRVNMNSVDLSTEEGRNALESTIAHEMIHAFMDEALTAGMLGITSDAVDSSEQFPMWFIEGMAQTASGPGNWVYHGLGITPDSTTSEIKSALAGDPLTSSGSNTAAQYGTGYLACMYLGYLAAGSDANISSSTAAASDILSGLNSILSDVISGKSLNSVINEISGGKYSTASAFASGFANDTAVQNFVQSMAQQGYFSTDYTPNDSWVSDVVSGGLISGDLLNADPYPNSNLSLNLFALDKNNTAIKNTYPDGVTVLSGGTVSTEGVKPMENMPETPNNKFGDFTVTGGTEGIDFEYDEGTGTLTVLTGTALTIEGTGNATTDKIKIGDGITANVTIKNVNIDVSDTYGACAFEVGDGATVNLTLEGTNTLKSGWDCAGLQVQDGETLVITENSTGSLDATGDTQGAGIGGRNGGSAGNIEINGGTVTATGGDFAAGIGGGNGGGSGGNIEINGGTVTATGGNSGAGIGGGPNGSGGNIEINGGTVTATGGNGGAGIGGGVNSSGGNIVISGGEVTAVGSTNFLGEVGAAIGDGANGSGGTFSTGTNGNADITVSNTDGDTEIADLISDTSGIDVWSAKINGKQYPLPLAGTGNIDLSTLTGDLEIVDGGYKIGNKTYTYSGDYTFTGTTDKNITVSNGGTTNISLDGATLGEFAVKGNSTVNMNVTGENTAEYVHVENGSKLNITGDGTLNTNQGIGNEGTLTNDSTINNDGLLDNEGTLTNGENGTINNDYNITNKGSITNSGDINNASGSTITNNTGGTITNNGDINNESGGTINNTGGTLTNNGNIDNDGTMNNGTTRASGTIKNNGTIDNSGDISNASKGNIENSGDINNENSGSISNSGAVTNKSGGEISNSGDVTNNDSGTIANSGNITNENSGTITNSGEVTNKSGGTVENAGSVTNNDGGTIDNSGTITNSGEITNASGGIIDNNGDIDSTGGTLTNDGEIKSRPDSNIDGTVSGTQPTDAPAKADGEDDEDGDFEDGENVWIMQTGGRSKDTFVMDIGRMNTKILGVHKDDINISTQMNANRAIDVIGEAVNKLSTQRADIGAYQKRLEHKIDNLNVTRENLIAAESKIRDTDMAAYMMQFTKNQILNNTAQAMLAQATSLPQGIMSLVQ